MSDEESKFLIDYIVKRINDFDGVDAFQVLLEAGKVAYQEKIKEEQFNDKVKKYVADD